MRSITNHQLIAGQDGKPTCAEASRKAKRREVTTGLRWLRALLLPESGCCELPNIGGMDPLVRKTDTFLTRSKLKNVPLVVRVVLQWRGHARNRRLPPPRELRFGSSRLVDKDWTLV
jgi:hypothetical protein